MNIQIYRTNASSYQDSHFFQREKEALEKIPGVRYIKSLNEMNPSEPFILLTNTHTQPEKLPSALLDKTALIIHPNSGHDNFSPEFLSKCPFPIVLGNPIRSHAVAEYTMSTLFQHFTKVDNHLHWDDNRQWNRKLLRDQKALIIGHGHIGKILNRALEPLCRDVIVYDPFMDNSFANEKFRTEFDLNMFEGVQLLILAASLNRSSHHMINHDVLKRLDSECVIVNPARGPLIKEDDLILFLQKNPKAFAYLDVFEQEPFKPGYLHDLKNINKTSHIAGVYEKLNKDIINFEFHIIKEFVTYLESQETENFKIDYQSCLLSSRLKDNILI
jgi:phosphoglycerate dehydrogenase-like enzyme